MEQKTINVHPDLLFLSKGKTQKNRKKTATSDSAIKVKNNLNQEMKRCVNNHY